MIENCILLLLLTSLAYESYVILKVIKFHITYKNIHAAIIIY